MGKIEEKVRKRKKRADVQRIILTATYLAGIAGMIIVAPNTLSAFGILKKWGLLPKRQIAKRSITRARTALLQRGFLREESDKLFLTNTGERALLLYGEGGMVYKKRWDKKWRMIIFDIPEKRKKIREQARRLVRGAGFYRLQDSVWVHPFPQEEFVALLKSELRIGSDMLYLVVEEIEKDSYLKNHFSL